MFFLNTINKANTTPILGNIQSTNPCGEVPLIAFESCNLGSINLAQMLYDSNKIDWEKLKTSINTAIRFLDAIITVNHYIITKNKNITNKNRKIGLGIISWAEMLIQLNLPYALQEAIILGEKIMQFIQENSSRLSKELAVEKGEFPEWKNSIYYPKTKLRNATCNSIAPTGTISIIANTSYSIEPLYALAFKRSGILNGKNQYEINRFSK